mmetsp:Transcript_46904/g.135631  ORF Transcript_46904/g.135631 Transcript_46904/m.135631 type:complete len:83 (+) Transcript_46904:593-841(+)
MRQPHALCIMRQHFGLPHPSLSSSALGIVCKRLHCLNETTLQPTAQANMKQQVSRSPEPEAHQSVASTLMNKSSGWGSWLAC